jgi:tetratricopeptide (TPR) repeat protein
MSDSESIPKKMSLFDRVGGVPPALAARLGLPGASSDTAFPAAPAAAAAPNAAAAAAAAAAPKAAAAVSFAVPMPKKVKSEAKDVVQPLTPAELLERARSATERQQLDLADFYYSVLSSQHAARMTGENVLDHASVLLLLGDAARSAALVASALNLMPASSPAYERAVYLHGAALLAAEDYSGSKAALQRGLELFPHSQQMKESLAEAAKELAASVAGESANEAMNILLLASPPINMHPTFTLQYFDRERISSVASPTLTVSLTPVTLRANVAVKFASVLQPKVRAPPAA